MFLCQKSLDHHLHVKKRKFCNETKGAFHYARPTGQRPVELTKRKWNDIVWKKENFQPDRRVPFTFRPKFRLLLSEEGLETRIFENGRASFGRTRPTGQRGPPLKVDLFFRKIFTWIEALHLCFDRNFRKFWYNGKPPKFPLKGQSSGFTIVRWVIS